MLRKRKLYNIDFVLKGGQAMTKEQEAIERLNRIITTKFNNDYSIDSSDKEAIETVLSMLKEKDKLINEQLKENVKMQKELNEENKRCMILANNDKFKEQVIDLMADFIDKTGAGRRAFSCTFRKNYECDENGCRSCIKKYFNRKVNSSEQN